MQYILKVGNRRVKLVKFILKFSFILILLLVNGRRGGVKRQERERETERDRQRETERSEEWREGKKEGGREQKDNEIAVISRPYMKNK